jgi:hypothetical protein
MIKSGRMRWMEHVACIGEKRYAYDIFCCKREGETIWKNWDNIEMDFKEIAYEGMEWINLVHTAN